MKKLKIFLTIAVIASLAVSCSKENPTKYTTQDHLYFWHKTFKTIHDDIEQADTLMFSFKDVDINKKQDTVYVVLQVNGNISGVDRPYRVRVVPSKETDAAVENKHYLPFDQISDLLFVPAGSEKAYLPVVALRDPDLETRDVRLEIEIAENEYFKRGIEDYQRFTVIINDAYVKPQYWDTTWYQYFGKSWGQVKMWFLKTYIVGDWNFTDEGISTHDIVEYWGAKARRDYAVYRQEHGPLYESDDTEITFEDI